MHAFVQAYNHLAHRITYCMVGACACMLGHSHPLKSLVCGRCMWQYSASHKKPTTLWISGFDWQAKPVCGTKRSSSKPGQSHWKCSHLKKGRVRKHPARVENMNMEEKVALPGPLVVSLMQPMVQQANIKRGSNRQWVAACTKFEHGGCFLNCTCGVATQT